MNEIKAESIRKQNARDRHASVEFLSWQFAVTEDEVRAVLNNEIFPADSSFQETLKRINPISAKNNR